MKSDETKLKMSNYSKSRSEEHLKKLSKSLTGLIRSKEHCDNISKSKMGKIPHNKGISKYNFNIPYVIEKLKCNSCMSIAKEYNCNEGVLRRFIKNNTQHSISHWKTIKEKKEKIKLPF